MQLPEFSISGGRPTMNRGRRLTVACTGAAHTAFLAALALGVCCCVASSAPPVLRNPGLPTRFTMEIRDHLDDKRGYVTAVISIAQQQDSCGKFYAVACREGDAYANDIRLNCADLTSVSEKRTDLRSGSVIEQYQRRDRGRVHFTNAEKRINRDFAIADDNVYSRYAYFVSFMGYPFETRGEVRFKTFMFEYGNALPMRLCNLGSCRITVPAGGFDCYKLRLSVGGWQSMFSHDAWYLYFDVKPPHHFVRYDELDNGRWYSNDLVSYTEK
jgi:hypothetical protein